MQNQADPGSPIRISGVVAVGLGNALAFYDFLTFSFFAVQLGDCFFPASRHGLLFTLATFGVGFLARPLGGLILGGYGDRAGRKPAMLVCFALMGIGITGLALTPSYAAIGPAAPVLLVLFRLIQGFALGGEVGPSTAYLIEAAPPHRRGLYTSGQYAAQYVAILAAGLVGTGLAAALPPAALDAWGWRAAFLAGAAIVPVGLLLRSRLPETLGRNDDRAPADEPIPWRVVALGLLILGAGTIGSYSLNYMAIYAQDTLQLPPAIAFGSVVAEGATGIVVCVIAGMVADRFGRKPVMLAAMASQIVLVVPVFLWLVGSPGQAVLYASIAILCTAQNFTDVPSLLFITECLPQRARSGGLGTLYATAIAVFGGSTEFVIKALLDATGNPLAPAWYMTGALGIGACAMLALPSARTAFAALARPARA